jgi:toxin YoeB
MAKRIIWTQRALEEKIEILKYWNNRNKSNEYSKKLNQLFLDSTQLIQKFPSLGRPTEDPLVKNILARDYLIFYVETVTEYNIVHIWDERRNPNEMIYKVL